MTQGTNTIGGMLLDNLPEPIGMLLQTFGGSLLNNGPLSYPLRSQLGPGGMQAQFQRRQIQDYVGAVQAEMGNAQLRNYAELLARTWYGPDTDIGNAENYDEFIRNKVEGYLGVRLRNDLTRRAVTYFNAFGMGDMNKAAGSMLTGLATSGLAAGNRQSLAIAGLLGKNLLTGDQLTHDGSLVDAFADKAFNRYDWGGFSAAGAMGIAAELTKSMNFLNGADITSSKSLGDAVKRFRNSVKEYADALQPLRDVFGDDVKSMVEVLEKTSGRQVANMPVATVRSMSMDLASKVVSGQYDLSGPNGLLGMSATINGMLARTSGLPVFTYLAGPGMAGAAMDMQGVKGGYRPTYLTDSQWGSAVRRLAFGSGASSGANMLAMGYAIWRHSRGLDDDGNEQGTMEEYQEALEKSMRDSGTRDYRIGIMRLAGVSSPYELSLGRQYSGYREALESNSAGRLASKVYSKQVIAGAREIFAGNWLFAKAVGTRRRDRAGRYYDEIMDTIRKDPRFLDMTEKEVMEKYHDKHMVRLLRGARVILSTPGIGVKLIDNVVAQRAASQAEDNQRRYEAIKTFAPELDQALLDAVDRAAEKGTGLNLGEVRGLMESSRAAAKLTTADREQLGVMIEALGASLGTVTTDKDKEFARRAVNYGLGYMTSSAGMSDVNFQRLLQRQVQLQRISTSKDGLTAEQQAEMGVNQRALFVMSSLPSSLNGKALDRFLKTEVRDKNGNRLTGKELYEHKSSIMDRWIKAYRKNPNRDIAGMVQSDYLRELATGSSDTGAGKRLNAMLDDYDKQSKEEQFKQTPIEYIEKRIQDAKEQSGGKSDRQLDVIARMVSEAKEVQTEDRSPLTGLIEVLGRLVPALEGLVKRLPSPSTNPFTEFVSGMKSIFDFKAMDSSN